MRLAFVSDNAYPWFNGGIEKRRYIIMHSLVKEGHEVHCFTMQHKHMPGREFRRNGIRYHCVARAMDWEGMYRGGSARRSIRMPLLFASSIFFAMLPYTFDAVDADSFPFLHLFPVWLYARLRGIRFAITWHEVWSSDFWSRYLSGLGRLGYLAEWLSSRLADTHIANSSTTKELLGSVLGVEPGMVMTFPVAVDSEEVARFTRLRCKKRRQFISIARLVSHKRVWLAIKAVAKTDARLLVVGSGPDLRQLELLAKESAPGRVLFRQRIGTGALYRSLMESQALLMTSAREGLSLVTIEALAAGVPVVIATTSVLPKEIRRMCVEAKEEELGSLLNDMLSNPRYARDAMRRRRSVLATFSGDSSGAVYRKVAGARH